MCNLLMSLLFLSLVSAIPTDVHEKQVYIVYMGSLPSRTDYSPVSHHIKILQEITGESSVEHLLLTSYKKSFNGFVALLTESERERLSKSNEVVSVFPNKSFQLHTTTSWNFMGLKEGKGTKRNPPVESDTIIGVIDSGITPESDSFSCEGFAPPPKKWKGVCLGGNKFNCNKKLIGARDYTGKGDVRDYSGHGTHTASTAAGNAVPNTSFYGIGNGTVRGVVPASRIAVYKACVNECIFNHTLSAFEDAIHDGVDLITISLGANKPALVYESDAIAIGAFHAMAKGILTVQSAGNDGPESASVVSVAPWILTVAASTTNRGFFTKVVLGNGKTLLGKSVNLFDHEGKKYPLVYGKSATLKSCDEKSAKECSIDCLDESLVNGSILVCNVSFNLGIAQYFGAIAVVGKNPKVDVANIELFPISILPEDDFNSLVSYIESTDSPQAAVLKTEAIYNQTAPKIASFSSRGPNNIVADLLKPDISAPGVEILAAYSPEASLTEDGDTRHVKYSILSGTSMSCPHVAGVAAYVKSFHPEWSPSMIKSAIMTTAWVMKPTETGFVSSEFAYGAGHVDPIAALTPGLVYELTKADYISFLCGLNYNGPKLKLITGDTDTCTGKTLARNLNYPSMSAKIPEGNSSFSVTFIRTVTNVGNPNSTYKANVVLNCSKLNVEVLPCVLTFNSVAEKKTFTVTVTGNGIGGKAVASANLIWSDSDGIYNVRSPIVMYSL